MTFLEHLDELRRRLLTSLYVLIACCGVAFIFWQPLYAYFVDYFGEHGGSQRAQAKFHVETRATALACERPIDLVSKRCAAEKSQELIAIGGGETGVLRAVPLHGRSGRETAFEGKIVAHADLFAVVEQRRAVHAEHEVVHELDAAPIVAEHGRKPPARAVERKHVLFRCECGEHLLAFLFGNPPDFAIFLDAHARIVLQLRQVGAQGFAVALAFGFLSGDLLLDLAIDIALLGIGVLAAIMSTADGLVISTSQVFANDLYRRSIAPRLHRDLSQSELDREAGFGGAATLLKVSAVWPAGGCAPK